MKLVRSGALVAILAFLVSGLAARAESEPELPALLFVITGQSNAGQKGDAAQLAGPTAPGTFYYAPQHTGVRAWLPMQPYRGHFGIEQSFARAVAEATGRTVLVAKTYSGGTSIIAWQPTDRGRQWRRDMAAVGNATKPAMYPRVTALVTEATAAWGGPVELAGVLYVQVERDSRYQYGAVRYESNLRRLIAAWRADYGTGLPVMFIDAHSHMTSGGPIVAAAVRAVAADTPNTAMISVRDLPKQDAVHFSSAGVDELGRRFAAAWLAMGANK